MCDVAEHMEQNPFADLVAACGELNADCFVFNADVSSASASTLIRLCRGLEKRRAQAAVFVATYGGLPESAYRMARELRRLYEKVTYLVFGECKSAGTLMVLGGNEIVVDDEGELGPLDMQTSKDDDLFRLSSTLNASRAMQEIAAQAYTSFDGWFITVLRKSGGRITTATAADIAAKLAVGLYAPLMEKLDPAVIGEHARMVESAIEYAYMLCPPLVHEGAVAKLVFGYPTHGFVIDREELAQLFTSVSGVPVVREPTEAEERLAALLDRCRADIVRDPTQGMAKDIVLCLNPLGVAEPSDEQVQAGVVEEECPQSTEACGSDGNDDHSGAAQDGAIDHEQDILGEQDGVVGSSGDSINHEAAE